MKFSMKRLAALVLALVMVIGLMPVMNNTANAVDVTGLTDGTIGLSYVNSGQPNANTSGWTASGNTITGTLQGVQKSVIYMAATSTLTITNNKSSAATLTFDYTFTTSAAGGTVTIDGETVTGGSFSKKLDAGESINIVVSATRGGSSKDNAMTISITNLGLASASTTAVTTTFEAPAYGSYTVAYGEELLTVAAGTASQTASNLPSVAYTLTATPGEGYKMVGWYNVTSGKYLGTDLTYTGYFEDPSTVKAVIVPESIAVFKVGSNYYSDLNEAVAYAEANSLTQITLVQSGILSEGSYTIPAGITLLIPMDADYTPTRTDDEDFGVAPEFTTEVVTPYAYLTMTMAEGASLTVNGTLDIESKHTSLQGGSNTRPNGGRPSGAYGAIYMNPNSSITVNDGANLYAWGYVYGDGTVAANSGAKVYEIMQVTDFPGGSNMSLFVDTDPTYDVDGDGNPANDYIKTFPFSQYYVQNIEVALTLNEGAAEYVYITMTAGGQSMGLPVRFIGEGGMFVPGEGGTIVKDYDPSTDRLNVTVNGDASMSGIALDLTGTKYEGAVEDVLGTSKVDSASFILTLNGNITIDIVSGTTTIKQDLALLPGVEISIAKDATLVIGERSYADDEYDNLTVYGSYTGYNVYVWDLDNWGNFVFSNASMVALSYSPTTGRYVRTSSDLKDVVIDINGTVICEGYIYSTVNFDDENWVPVEGAGAQVISSGKTGQVVLQNGAGIEDMAWCLDGTSGADSAMFVDSVWLQNGDGSYELTDGAEAGATYLYCEGHDCWYTEGHKDKTVEITWLIEGVGGPEEYTVCTTPSYKGTTPTKPQSGCTVYTFTGWATSADGEVLIELPIVEADAVYYAIFTESTSHSWGDADCESAKTCSVCGQTEGTALGHTWVDPDCENDGYCSVCGAAGEAALGHIEGEPMVYVLSEPTCTGTGLKQTLVWCTACNTELVNVIEETAALGHTEAEAVEENRVDAICTEDGSYDMVVYCSVCGDELERTSYTIPATGHTAGEAVIEGEFEGSCTEASSYDSVVYCTECGEEISRETIYGETLDHGHTEGLMYDNNYDNTHSVICLDCGETIKDAESCTFVDYECEKCGATQRHTITFMNGDEVFDTYDVEHGETANFYGMPVPAKDGYHWVGWFTEDGTKLLPGATITEDITVYATQHELTYVAAQDATCTEDGNIEYYHCADCDKNYEYNAEYGVYIELTDSVVIGAAGHSYEAVVTDPTCTESGYTTYTCTVCGDSYEADPVDALGHSWNATGYNWNRTYQNTGTVHGPYVSCQAVRYCPQCETIETANDRSLDSEVIDAGDCVTLNYIKYTAKFETVDWAPDAEIYAPIDYNDSIHHGPETYTNNGDGTHTKTCSACSTDIETVDHDYTSGESAYTCICGEEYTGWETLDNGTRYILEGEMLYGWNEVDGSWYYFAPETGYRAEGITRVPYPADAINGVTYGPNAEDLASADKYGYTDATTGLFVFGEDGKFDQTTGPIKNDSYEVVHYAVNGQLPWHLGFVQVGSHMYYFIGENVKATGDVYVSRGYNVYNFVSGGIYTFGADGNICRYSGITEMEDGTLRYYESYRLMIGNGLTAVDENYIYVNAYGELIVDAEYYVPANDYGIARGIYTFDENGYLVIPEEEPGKSGLYFEDGKWYYYVDGAKAYCAGLIEIDGNWVYVKSDGSLATGAYYVTNTNGHETIASGDKCLFDENGFLQEALNGIVDGCYYVDNSIAYAAGLVEYNGGYIYVRSNGQVVTNCQYWITNVNDTGVEPGYYQFDENGMMQEPLNGIVDGYFYVNNSIAYAAGLVEIEPGKYIYVRSNGQIATGKYWITNHNDLLAEGFYDFGEDGYLTVN